MPFGQAKTQGFNAPQILNFQVASLVFNKQGLFFYNGTPGLGNPPIMSFVLSTVGTDPYGNTIYDYMTIGQYGVSPIRFVPGNPSIIEFVVPGAWNALPSIAAQSSSIAALFLESGSDTTGLDSVAAVLESGVAGSGANGFLTYHDGNGGNNTDAEWGYQGLQLPVVASLSAVKPGTGTSPTNPATVEGWNSLTLATGFAAGSQAPQYRKQPDGTVRLRGGFTLTGTHAANTQFWAIPGNYQASVDQFFTGPTNLSGFAGSNGITVHITSSGTALIAVNGVSGNFVTLDGMSYVLV